ncbi:MAG: ABC transporter permease [Fibrobacter sp.]|jgi:phospholipid/cholesterol/gamma-HCH transport system permease protein|nr:ABC transporter permease [Fibrobacter sp.]
MVLFFRAFDSSVEALGRHIRRFLKTVFSYFHFIWEIFKNLPAAISNLHTTVEQMYVMGVTSIPVVFAASVATGAIMAWQLAYQFADMIPLVFVGMAVGKSVMVELCPILTAMVLAGRVGAAMCSELGTMAVTEQLDAYKALGLNPFRYLLVPRVVATMIMLPVLTIFSIFVGILGGFVVAYLAKDVSWHVFFYGVRMFYENWDFAVGLIKALLYGFFISSYACFFGYTTHGGAEGVGKNTKATVVAGMTSILIGGFVLSKLLLV